MAFFHETFSVDDNLAALTNSPNDSYLFGQGDLQAVPNVSKNLIQAIEEVTTIIDKERFCEVVN